MMPDSDHVVRLLRTIALELNLRGADFATANDLHVTDLRAIIELLDAERDDIVATPTWLGDRMRLNSASVTALVDRLERGGHVERMRDPYDRRRIRLSVTVSAKQLGLAYFGPLIGRIMAAMDEFDEGDLATITRFLTVTAASIVD